MTETNALLALISILLGIIGYMIVEWKHSFDRVLEQLRNHVANHETRVSVLETKLTNGKR